MKKAIIIIALSVFLKPVFPVIEYIVNYDYIAKTLCVNKAKPKMHCNGKCHLMKELAKAAEAEKPMSPDKKDNAKHPIEELFFQDIKSLVAEAFVTRTQRTASNYYSNLYCYKLNHSVFHPPIFIA
ncbi:hypothetical protein [Flavobacterium sp.]|uniref:hypothetical protein n=1 Tax=Flavobacterium sp. TaxID=239 RepID=UPI002637CD5D|nr:hypothetical protein [Flavobacterium sp.]